jgi:hypothetical protein
MMLQKENEMDLTTLDLCSDDDLRELGIPKGPRVKILSGDHIWT